jgi:site-specific DNA-methyltransferase (adenine-specific)
LKRTAGRAPRPRNDGLTIVNDDVLHTRAVSDGSIDLAVTSPPYNVGIDYGTHDDHTTYRQYLAFSRKWLARCHAWLAPGGRLCLNVPLDKNKGGQQSVGADLTAIAKDAGFHYHATIVWNEGNISRRTAWGSWLSPTAPYVIAPVELIVVLYKGEWRRARGERTSDIERDEFMAWTNGLWTFPGERKTRIGHPAPFPLELPRRCRGHDPRSLHGQRHHAAGGPHAGPESGRHRPRPRLLPAREAPPRRRGGRDPGPARLIKGRASRTVGPCSAPSQSGSSSPGAPSTSTTTR